MDDVEVILSGENVSLSVGRLVTSHAFHTPKQLCYTLPVSIRLIDGFYVYGESCGTQIGQENVLFQRCEDAVKAS